MDRMRVATIVILIGLATSGCAVVPQKERFAADPDRTLFERIGVIDYRYDTVEDYRKMVQPGDLIVCYMRPGRAVAKRQWVFTFLPHGHAMIVLDPNDPAGILECRFHGIRQVGDSELGLYSYNTVYRLRNPSRLNMRRLFDFAHHGSEVCHSYSLKSWAAFNDELTPNVLEDISCQYTCSSMVVAAYYYAGLTLDVSANNNCIITPTSIATSPGSWNEFALPLVNADDPNATGGVSPAR